MNIFLIGIFIITFPLVVAAEKFPVFESLKFNEVNLRHYPEKDDPYLKTIKFKLTKKNMPVKVLGEFNSGGKIVEWRHVELFNGIEGWIYHTQLSEQRTLLLKKDKNLYLFNSFQKESFKTKIKAKIFSPEIVKLEKLKNNMAKIQLNHDEKLISGWIIIDESVWGLFDEEIN